jgi:hypothetical protein
LAIVSVKLVVVVPSAGSVDGLKLAATVGGATKVNRSAEPVALVPPGVVTVTSTVPVPAGDVAVIELALLTVNEAASVAPNFTAATLVKFVPLMVTEVPPDDVPIAGDTAFTVGGGGR